MSESNSPKGPKNVKIPTLSLAGSKKSLENIYFRTDHMYFYYYFFLSVEVVEAGEGLWLFSFNLCMIFSFKQTP